MTWIFVGWMLSRFFVMGVDSSVGAIEPENTVMDGGVGQPPRALDGGVGALDGGVGQPPRF
jgi:hypothetical protein